MPRQPLPAFLIAIACCLGSCCLHAEAAAAPPGPAPFTGHLQEVHGVLGVLSLRHPKLLGEDLEKMMKGVPETAALRMFLLRAAPFGYPEFSEIAAGSNLGILLLAGKDGGLDAPLVWVGMAQLKAGGADTALLIGLGMKLRVHGKWTFFAQSNEILGRVTDPDSAAAYLDNPQAQDLKAWFRISPGLVAKLKEQFSKSQAANPAAGSPLFGKIAAGYMKVFFSALEQMHSAEFSWSSGSTSLAVHYALQFKPQTPLGTVLRYSPSGSAAAEQSLPPKAAAITVAERINLAALPEAMDWFIHALPADEGKKDAPWTAAIKNYTDLWLQNADGDFAGAVDLVQHLPKKPQSSPPFAFLVVQSGHWTPESVRHLMLAGQAMSSTLEKQFMSAIPNAALGKGSPPTLSTSLREHAVTVEGIPFDQLESKWQMAGVTNVQTQLTGAVDGLLVSASSEQVLRDRLPAIKAARPPAHSRSLLKSPDQFLQVDFNGARTAEELFPLLGLDRSNPDVGAELRKVRAAYDAAGSASVSGSIGQAQVETTVDLPYGFIETSIQLSIYLTAKKVDWTRLVAKPMFPPPPRPQQAPLNGQTL